MKLTMRKGMLLTLILLSMGIIGGVLFFPINFNNQYTCLYHRIFAPDHRYQLSNEVINSSESTEGSLKRKRDEMVHMELVEKYILPFGLIWWISLLVAGLAFFWLRHQKQIRENPKKPYRT